MNVRYSPRAISDLIGIADYLADKSPNGARSVELAIKSTIQLISEFPGSGRVLAQRSNVRVMPLSRHPYLVFYTINTNATVILHIRHGARRPVDSKSL
jgi:toxin ParE1/3/4